MLYSYRDELPEELQQVWEGARSSEADEDEPTVVLAGFGREGIVVTDVRIYVLRASYLNLGGGGWQKASVHPLSDLAAAEVRQGFLVHHLRLGFHEGPEEQVLVRSKDRDKMRVAARMLASMAITAKSLERERAIVRSTRAAAEAAASRTDRSHARVEVVRPGQRPSAALDPLPPAPAAAAVSAVDALELLKGLWHLVEVGALSEAEFQAKKMELLGRL